MFGRVQAQFDRDKELREEKRTSSLKELEAIVKHGSGLLSEEWVKNIAKDTGYSEEGLMSMMQGNVTVIPTLKGGQPEPITPQEYDKRFGQPSQSFVREFQMPSQAQRGMQAGREQAFASEAITQELGPAQEARRVGGLQASTDIATEAGKALLKEEYGLKGRLEELIAKFPDVGDKAKKDYWDSMTEIKQDQLKINRDKTRIDAFNKIVKSAADIGIMKEDDKGRVSPVPVKKDSPEYNAQIQYWKKSGIGYEEMPTKDPRLLRFTDEYIDIAPLLGDLESGAKGKSAVDKDTAVSVTGFDEKSGMVKITEGGRTRAIKAERSDGKWVFRVNGKSYEVKGNR